MPKPDEILFTVGPYQILRSIGKGGMGEVFLAYDTICKRNVALKRLTTEKSASAEDRKQFLKEANYTSLLTHPAIIPVYSVASEGDEVYYTMPFIEGKTLKELMTSDQAHETSISTFCQIFLRICQAVAYAHSKGFIHRDLKPSNIMVGDYGEVFILDWGLVEPAPNQDAPKRRKKLIGTMAYTAPDIIYGGQPTFQTEIYSLGLVLYQMLTLRNPFHRSDIQEYYDNIQSEVLVDPAKVAPYRNIPPIMSQIALKCLAESTDERYKTVEELLHDLQTYLEQKPDPLAVADALLAHRLYPEALKEYRKIGSLYPDTDVGRKGLFYAGISLLESGNPNKALKEFEKINGTSASPLAHLGKVLVYKTQKKYKEAAATFEKAFHHNRKHPLLNQLQQALMDTLPECVAWPRPAALTIFMLAARYLPTLSANAAEATAHFRAELEPAFFLREEEMQGWAKELQMQAQAIQLAFWLSRSDIIAEIIDEALVLLPAPLPIIQDGLMALIELGELEMAQEKLDLLFQRHLDVQARAKLEPINVVLQVHREGFKLIDERFFNSLPHSLTKENLQPVWHILEEALEHNKIELVHNAATLLRAHTLSDEQSCRLDFYVIWAFLQAGNLTAAARLLNLYGPKNFRRKADAFNFLYGCQIAAKKGKLAAVKHFSMLASQKLPDLWKVFLEEIKKIHGKRVAKQNACPWEQKRLDRRLSLFRSSCR